MNPTRGWKCCRTGCGAKAGYFPIVYLWAVGCSVREKRYALPAIFPLPHCGPCSTTTGANDLLSDAGFAQISASVVGAGRAAPDRASARVEFKRLDQFGDFVPKAIPLKLPPENWVEPAGEGAERP